MSDNINPMWEKYKVTDEEVVEYYQPLQEEGDKNKVTPDDIGKKSLNTKLANWMSGENFTIRKKNNLAKGMSEEDAIADAQEYADALHANTLLAFENLYKAKGIA